MPRNADDIMQVFLRILLSYIPPVEVRFATSTWWTITDFVPFQYQELFGPINGLTWYWCATLITGIRVSVTSRLICEALELGIRLHPLVGRDCRQLKRFPYTVIEGNSPWRRRRSYRERESANLTFSARLNQAKRIMGERTPNSVPKCTANPTRIDVQRFECSSGSPLPFISEESTINRIGPAQDRLGR